MKAFGWVRDMYSYSFAAARSGVRHHTALVPLNTLMAQIPADSTLGEAVILHFTWGLIVSVNGTKVWRRALLCGPVCQPCTRCA